MVEPLSSRLGLSRRKVLGAASVAVAAGALTACGSSSKSGTAPASALPSASLEAELAKPATLTFWSWTPGTQKEVDLFEKKYPNIKVNLVNAGQGTPEYTKLRTALKAGKGAPDCCQIEFQYIPTFNLGGDLLDLVPYGANDVKSAFVDWTWNQVSIGGKVLGMPWDTGPMGLLYREDIFTKYGIAVPKTWADFATAGDKLHAAAPGVAMTTLGNDQIGQFLALMWQLGAKPFEVDGSKIKINMNGPEAQKVANFIEPLVESGVISTDTTFNNDWYAGLANGRYATWFSAAWGPIFLQGSAAKSSGKWRAAPLPQWDVAKPSSGNWGGSTIAVMSKTKYPAASAAFAKFMMTDPASVQMFSETQFLFPSVKAELARPAYIDQKLPFYGGQQVNKVFAAISETVATDFQWDPFHDYMSTAAQNTYGAAMIKRKGIAASLDALQANLVTYAKQQGFTVTT